MDVVHVRSASRLIFLALWCAFDLLSMCVPLIVAVGSPPCHSLVRGRCARKPCVFRYLPEVQAVPLG